MFWNTLYWSDFARTSQVAVISRDFMWFNDFSLEGGFIVVQDFNFEDSWDSEYQAYSLPGKDGTGFQSRLWRKKKISIKWILKSTTKEDLESIIDQVKYSFSKKEGLLKVKYAWEYRKIRATCTDIRIQRKAYHINFVPFEIVLISTDSFMSSVNDQNYSFTGITGNIAEEVDNQWYQETYPILTLVVASASWTNSVVFSSGGKSLTYSWSIGAWWILKIDSANMEVLLNWVSVDFTWVFPKFDRWINQFTLNINGTFSADVAIKFSKNYL